jgi:hypothetical protein
VNVIHINWQTFNAEILARSAQITLCESYQDTLNLCNVRFLIIVNLYCYVRGGSSNSITLYCVSLLAGVYVSCIGLWRYAHVQHSRDC